jgi:cation:H+ antiporter
MEPSIWPALRWVFLLGALGIPAVFLRFSGTHLEPGYASLLYGLGIVGGAFLLAWAAEAAQVDVSASLAIACLAIITILPEYVIEFVLAWNAGNAYALNPVHGPELSYVAANVTGANRLLIGFGWSIVVLLFWLKRRQSMVELQDLGLEIIILLAATVLTFVAVATRTVPLWLAGVLVGLYLWYLFLSSRKGAEEPDLEGPSAAIGALAVLPRRATVLSLFAYAAFIILVSAEPFVDGLIETGKAAGIDEFLLIQWLAPLASESPEIVVAVIFALRANPAAGITVLVSAELSQMTVLIGSMPAVFSVALGRAHAFPLDSQQATEFMLTAALSLLAITLLARMRLYGWQAGLLLVGFIGHLFFHDEEQRRITSYILLGLTGAILLVDRGRLKALLSMAKSMVPAPVSGK